MADYYITATQKDGPDPDYRIDAFRVNGDWYSLEQMLGFVRAGHRFFVVVWGRAIPVIKKVHPRTFREYLTTTPDSFPPNNLLNLPDS
ncbi:MULTISPECIES: DUF3892 domain-containing protein [unclassified Erythrobacter]|jgi:hypothetical protein|uniref:DUF3892 domain-containing protein n=1 Tax=unclassified Erythrobacter TaxID=2633097 RepID=UPI0007B9219B|nr:MULTISPECIES: DUF3892 domain-containing protein [unclassified Erythrobacter]KZY90855.1 hypothetical protein A3745_05485 [Erythrobacter sp. HI0074]KZZ08682.1 hypothetical protein A3748_10950 [Erythrobacter sp. HI0077]